MQHPAQGGETAAHLADPVLPRLPVRQWELSVPMPLWPSKRSMWWWCTGWIA